MNNIKKRRLNDALFDREPVRLPIKPLPEKIVTAKSPDLLISAVMDDDNCFYNKVEVLMILAKLQDLYKPVLEETCSYIN